MIARKIQSFAISLPEVRDSGTQLANGINSSKIDDMQKVKERYLGQNKEMGLEEMREGREEVYLLWR